MKQKNSRKLDSLFIILVAFYTVIPNILLGKDSSLKELPDHQNFKHPPLNIIDNPFRYTEYYKDLESSLYYCKARYYSPKLMRFISRDTYDLSNRYAYCDGSPIGESDPSGHEGGIPNYVNYLIGGILLGTLAIATIINPPSGCSLYLTIGSLAFNGAGLGFQIASDCTTGETSANLNGPPIIFFPCREWMRFFISTFCVCGV